MKRLCLPGCLLAAYWFCCGLGFAAGEVPGLRVQVSGGMLHEYPSGHPENLVQDELYPDTPFLAPIPPATVGSLREFFERSSPTLELTANQLNQIHERSREDPAVLELVDRAIAAAEKWLGVPVPQYEPSPFHWIRAPAEEAGVIERKAAMMASIRRECALAFALTGREAFADKSWEALQAHISHFYTFGAFRMPHSWQSPWDAGYELYDAAAAYDLISHWEGLRPLDHGLVFTYLRRLGLRVQYAVELSPVIGSQQAMWTCNLGAVALWAPSLPEAKRWPAMVDERMESVMADFMPDGGQIECTPEVHAEASRFVLRFARVAGRCGDDSWLRRKWGPEGVTIEKVLDWVASVATPLGQTPAINDSRRRPIATYPHFIQAINMYRRGDWLRSGRITAASAPLGELLDPAIQPTDPNYSSVLLPDTGFAVMRDGWQPTDAYLLLDYGRHGGGHGHLDKLSFELYSHGEPWILDAGAAPDPVGHAEEHRTWHTQTIAHNTVLVDGESQSPTDGDLEAWGSGQLLDVAIARHSGYPDLLHRRMVFHPRGGYFLIVDEITNESDTERDLTWLAHVNGRRESGTMGRVVFWRADRAGLSITPARQRGLRGVEIGEGLCAGVGGNSSSVLPDDPSGLRPGEPGWAFIPSIGLRKSVPAHGRQTFCVLLAPFKGHEPQSDVTARDGRGALGIEVRIGQLRDRILLKHGDAGDGLTEAVGLKTDGKWAYVRERDGKREVLETDGESLSVF